MRVGSGPWSVGAMAVVLLLGAFGFILGGWLWIQREVDISDGTIVVRRWIDILRGRPGIAIPVDPATRTSITSENVRSLRIERNGVAEARLTLGYWEPKRIDELTDALRAHGVEFSPLGESQ